jgi:uncharacterized iron-regulated membrane protein
VSCAQLGLGMPMGAEGLRILAFTGIIVAVAVAVFAVLASGRRPAPDGFPVGPPSGPSKFKASGVKRDSRQDVVWHCEPTARPARRSRPSWKG